MIIKGQKANEKIIGSFKINSLIYVYMSIILVVPIYSYYKSVQQKQQPPFPHTTITNTACHYPQAHILRWGMLTASGFLTLIFHTIFRWYDKQAKNYEYPGGTYAYMYWPTMLAVLGYMAAIATIDTGGTGLLHEVGAIYFFACLYFLMANLTVVSREMRAWDTRSFTKCSILAKMLVTLYFNSVVFYCFYRLVFAP